MALRIAELGSTLLPKEPGTRMRAIQWVIAALNSVEPWIMRIVAERDNNAASEVAGDGMTASGQSDIWSDQHGRLAVLDAAIGDKQWLDGDIFTVGDLMMVSVLGNLRNTAAFANLPHLASYVARAEARPAHIKATEAQLSYYDEADKRMQSQGQ